MLFSDYVRGVYSISLFPIPFAVRRPPGIMDLDIRLIRNWTSLTVHHLHSKSGESSCKPRTKRQQAAAHYIQKSPLSDENPAVALALSGICSR